MDVDDGPAKPAANGEAAPSSGARPVDVVSGGGGEEDTLPGVVRGFVDGVWSAPGGDEPLLRRLKAASCEAAPRLRGASRNSARDLLEWTRRGSGLRAILVISVGTITLIALTGLLIFMFFLLVATANAVIVSVLMSLAAAGGFLAIFFACLVAVYVGAVSVAVFAISATVISAIVGVMIATGVSRRASAKTPGMQTFSLRKGGRPAAVSRIPPRITSRQLAPACVGRRRSSGKEADEEGARGGGCCRRRARRSPPLLLFRLRSAFLLRPRGRSRRRSPACSASAPPACSASTGGSAKRDCGPHHRPKPRRRSAEPQSEERGGARARPTAEAGR